MASRLSRQALSTSARVSRSLRSQAPRRLMSADAHGHHEFKPKSDMPWIIGAAAITLPALAYLLKDTAAIKKRIAEGHHDDGHGHGHGQDSHAAHEEKHEEKHDEPAPKEEKSEGKEEKSDGKEEEEDVSKATSAEGVPKQGGETKDKKVPESSQVKPAQPKDEKEGEKEDKKDGKKEDEKEDGKEDEKKDGDSQKEESK